MPHLKNKKAVVIHSGGMDSSLCLALSIKEWGAENVLSLSFAYGQRHAPELSCAQKICQDWNVDHVILNISTLQEITTNALMDSRIPIHQDSGEPPNTLVTGRNGLMATFGAIYAQTLGANYIYMGVMELESANSGYLDCSQAYINLKQDLLRMDLNNCNFEIRTPLIRLTKQETMALAYEMGILEYLWENTISCYEGIKNKGCEKCPACNLRNKGLEDFLKICK